MKKLVYGVGINDADYLTNWRVNGKVVKCKYYSRWQSMMTRGYSDKLKSKNPTYTECSVVPEWHSFMNFKSWMEKQDWEGKCLDKDLLIQGNKVYGPDTCVFISHETNTFLSDGGSNRRGEYPIGVDYNKARSKYRYKAACGGVNIGMFNTPEEAHQAWYKRKRELAIELAAKQTDPRVAAALLARFP